MNPSLALILELALLGNDVRKEGDNGCKYNICIHTYIHTFVYTYIHKYIHTHIHTYRHTYIHTYVCIPDIFKTMFGAWPFPCGRSARARAVLQGPTALLTRARVFSGAGAWMSRS